MWKTNNNVANKIDGKSENIPDHFANIYSNLFNSIEDSEDLATLKRSIDLGVQSESIHYVEKVTPAIVKEASKRLNSGKSDPEYAFVAQKLAKLWSFLLFFQV